MFDEVAAKMTTLFPNAFSDMKRNEDGEWKIEYPDPEKDALKKRVDELVAQCSWLSEALDKPRGGDT